MKESENQMIYVDQDQFDLLGTMRRVRFFSITSYYIGEKKAGNYAVIDHSEQKSDVIRCYYNFQKFQRAQ